MHHHLSYAGQFRHFVYAAHVHHPRLVETIILGGLASVLAIGAVYVANMRADKAGPETKTRRPSEPDRATPPLGEKGRVAIVPAEIAQRADERRRMSFTAFPSFAPTAEQLLKARDDWRKLRNQEIAIDRELSAQRIAAHAHDVQTRHPYGRESLNWLDYEQSTEAHSRRAAPRDDAAAKAERAAQEAREAAVKAQLSAEAVHVGLTRAGLIPEGGSK